MKNSTPLLWVLLVLVVVLLGLEVYRLNGPPNSTSAQASTNAERARDYAAALKANQLYENAAEAYDAFLDEANLPDAERANIDFNTGTMLLDHVGDAEGALAHFLRVTELYENVDKEILKEARKLSAQCLEKLGRSGAAERQLVAQSKLGATDASAEQEIVEGEILAQIGERVSVTRTDFEEAWKQIPQYLRDQQFAEPDGKKKLLQELVATRLFAEAARRKGLDRTPEVQRRIQMVEDGFLSQKLMEEEISHKVTTPDSDLDLFYRANKARYIEPESVQIAHLLVSSATGIEAAQAAIASGSTFEQAVAAYSEDAQTKEKGGALGPIRQLPPPREPTPDFDPLDTSIPGVGKDKRFAQTAFALANIGDTTGPIQTPKGFHLLKLLSRTEPHDKTFEEVRPQVEAELRAQREEEQRAKLVAELMQAHKVRVFEDRLN